MELWVLRQMSVCSPHPWQTQVCSSCHPCHGSATAPKHTDFRDTAHRFEKESQSWVGAENSSFICVHIDKGSENQSVRTRASTPALVPLFAVLIAALPVRAHENFLASLAAVTSFSLSKWVSEMSVASKSEVRM